MSLEKKLDEEEKSLLQPCWLAGQRSWTAAHFYKSFQRHQIESVDIVASCKKITDIIHHNKKRGSNAGYEFRDIARLAVGATYILHQQVSTLLEDTEHLLRQLNGTTFDFSTPLAVKSAVVTQSSRKRKRVISQTTTTTTTMTVSKRARPRDLLDGQSLSYYSSLLNEPQHWNLNLNEGDSLVIEESVQTTSLLTESQTITQELTLDNEDLMLEQGFGIIESTLDAEDLMLEQGFGIEDPLELAILKLELGTCRRPNDIDIRECAKRKAPSAASTGTLRNNKMPRLETVEETAASIAHNASQAAIIEILRSESPQQEIAEIATVATFEVNAEVAAPAPSRKEHKVKSLIDKRIRLSRHTLKNQRCHYMEGLKREYDKLKQKPEHDFKDAKTLLSSFKLSSLFPAALKSAPKLKAEQKKSDCENTLRSIFGEDYTEDLAKDILAERPKRRRPEFAAQQIPLPMELEVITPPPLLPQSQSSGQELISISDNNNINKIAIDGDFDSFSVMSELLRIWRNDPSIVAIDANKFLKSFPDRIIASLAFQLLLQLSRDGFINISKKANSIEIDGITLGATSSELIANFSAAEQR